MSQSKKSIILYVQALFQLQMWCCYFSKLENLNFHCCFCKLEEMATQLELSRQSCKYADPDFSYRAQTCAISHSNINLFVVRVISRALFFSGGEIFTLRQNACFAQRKYLPFILLSQPGFNLPQKCYGYVFWCYCF